MSGLVWLGAAAGEGDQGRALVSGASFCWCLAGANSFLLHSTVLQCSATHSIYQTVDLLLSVTKHHLEATGGPALLDVSKSTFQTENYIVTLVNNHGEVTQMLTHLAAPVSRVFCESRALLLLLVCLRLAVRAVARRQTEPGLEQIPALTNLCIPEIFDETGDCIHELLVVPLTCSDLVEQFLGGERLLYTTLFKVLSCLVAQSHPLGAGEVHCL